MNSFLPLMLKVSCLALIAFVLIVVMPTAAKADSVLGVELSSAMCKFNPRMASLRQCIEGNPLTVNFYKVYDQSCTNSRYAVSPLQENVIAKVIPDVNVRRAIWQNYGRCSGMSPNNYFRQVTNLASQLKLPKELSSGHTYRVTNSNFVRQIMGLNPGLQPHSVNLYCQRATKNQVVLTYINVCYDNAGRFGQCASVSSTCPSQFMIDGNY